MAFSESHAGFVVYRTHNGWMAVRDEAALGPYTLKIDAIAALKRWNAAFDPETPRYRLIVSYRGVERGYTFFHREHAEQAMAGFNYGRAVPRARLIDCATDETLAEQTFASAFVAYTKHTYAMALIVKEALGIEYDPDLAGVANAWRLV